jgi:hypothetical protein
MYSLKDIPEHQTSTNAAGTIACQLSGHALDWAVARCVGGNPDFHGDYSPSTDWGQGGPLIAQYQIELKWIGVDGTACGWSAWHDDIVEMQCGPTTLIAAMRAIVAALLPQEYHVMTGFVVQRTSPEHQTSTAAAGLVGALRQYRHNSGSDSFVTGYDKEMTDRHVAGLVEALQKISLGSKNSMTSKEDLGREARAALSRKENL